jgi:hypothetical protein
MSIFVLSACCLAGALADRFTARNMDNIKEKNMLEVRKIKTVSFTQNNVVACLFAVHSTLFSVVCFRIHSVGARVFGAGRIGET